MSSNINPILPVSHQFEALPESFRARFRSFEFRAVEHLGDWAEDALLHTGYSLIDPAFGADIDFDKLSRHGVRRFSFDIGPCYEKVETVNAQYVGIGEKLTPDEVLSRSRRNLEKVRARFPTGCELAIENLNYYPTGAYDGVCDAEFYNEACKAMNVGLVFDIAHARVSGPHGGEPFDSFLEKIDFRLIREVHLSRPRLEPATDVRDAHDRPQADDFAILRDILARTPGPVDVAIEYYRDVGGIIGAYDDLAHHLGIQ